MVSAQSEVEPLTGTAHSIAVRQWASDSQLRGF
jgi:hypothetical protein